MMMMMMRRRRRRRNDKDEERDKEKDKSMAVLLNQHTAPAMVYSPWYWWPGWPPTQDTNHEPGTFFHVALRNHHVLLDNVFDSTTGRT